jgi:hypothetical protein
MATYLFRQKGEMFTTVQFGQVIPLAGGLLYYYNSGKLQ